jgi:hypothetical protein
VKIDDQLTVQRDGASQNGRRMPALDPAYTPIDERSIADLLRFARGYAAELNFYSEPKEPDGDWSAFLDGDLEALARSLANPAPLQAPAARPHVVLLLTFLELLQAARAQLNDLTRRHLEFYYREALRLTAGPPSPDRVHVLVDLAAGQEQFRLPAGTLLAAGQDSQGIDLHYRTDQEIIASQARVASLKSLFLQRQQIGIREAYQNPDLVAALFPQDSPWQALAREQRAFMAMLCLALGMADPGGALPPYPDASQPNRPLDAALPDLDRLVAFIQSDLAMPLPVFRTLIELKRKQDRADPAWQQINAILDSAGKRRVAGFQLDTSAPRDFERNLLAALGLHDFSTFFNTLPEVADIYDLYRLRERAEVREFIEKDNRLWMPFDDFVRMIGLVDDIYKDWRRIYDILRTAARRKTPGQVLAPPNLRAYDPNKFATLVAQTLGQPTFPSIVGQPGSLDACYDQVLKLEAYFHLPVEDFATIRDVSARGPAAKAWEWDQVFALLEQAFAAKALPKRWAQLRAARTSQGFDTMMRLALGDPAPGDPLPESRNFLALNPAVDEQYIREQLYLEVANATYIQRTQQSNPPDGDPAWETVYQMLELAERRKRGWLPPQPTIEQWWNSYAATDATQVQARLGPPDAVATPRWRTFGAGPTQPDQHVVPADVGFAIASPLLALAEGDRTITLTLTFDPDHFDLAAIQALLNAAPPLPLRFFLSAPDRMVEIMPAEANKPATIAVEAEAIQQPAQAGLLRLRLLLPAQAPPVAPLAPGSGISAAWPVLQVRLADAPDRHALYRAFQPLALQRVELKVEAAGLTQLTLQSDDGVLDPKKPFEPFGFAPTIGSSFAIAHPEICTKRLDSLTIQFDWLGAPDNFHEYYQGYASYQNPQPNPPPSPIADNRAFQGQLRLYDSRVLRDVQPIQLFQADAASPTTGATKPNSVTIDQRLAALQQGGYQQDPQPITADEALSWSRYWQIELLAPDFGHAVYPRAAAGYANRRAGANPDPFIVNPPYTPRIKRLSLGYSASESIDLLAGAVAAGKLYQIEPFGYRELAREDDGRYSFLPQLANEGELYIGIAGLAPPQNLALLFQLAEGSADPDVAREPVSWSYLDGDRWASLERGRLLYDTTNGLLSSGIIMFDLPPATASTRLPGGLYWLRVAVARNSRSIADMVAIEAQAVSATFVDQGNAPDHLSQPLPPNSISGLAEPLPEVRAIRQPYSSIGGKAPEQDSHFYTRISERLRHKNRALTSWDYERLILEVFPEIYKVKCLPAGAADDPRLADQIRIIIVPDIRGKLPFDPFEPKVAADTLARIAQYLGRHTSPDARFTVVNPTYIRLQVRLGVRLRPGYNPGYYLPALDQELQRFLAPWAYDQSAEIVFGGKVNASLIVNFVERRPYVDYMAGIKLYVRTDESADAQQIAPQFIVPPDAILVSDRQHQIDLISEEAYQEAFFTGIGAMRIELDFRVAAQ